MKFTLLLYDTTVFSYLLQLPSLYPIWKQLLYTPPFPFEIMLCFPSSILQNLPLSQLPPIFSTLSHTQPSSPFLHESALLTQWIQKCSFEPKEQEEERWLILNPRFLVSQNPLQRTFWNTFGEWLLSILHFFHRPRPHPTTTPLLWLPPPFDPFTFPKHYSYPSSSSSFSFLQNLPPFLNIEWAASCAVFSPEVFLSVGNYAPIDWGCRLEWVFRALLRTLPLTEHLIRPTCYEYRIQNHSSLLQTPQLNLSTVSTLPTVPQSPKAPGWEHRSLARIPVSMIEPEFSLHTWNAFCFTYPPTLFQENAPNREQKQKHKQNKKQILHPLQITWYSWDKNFKEKPPPSLFGARGQEALSVRTPLPLTVLWIGYNRFPLFRRALQTFLSQWIDYKKFHIVEYGIAIQELYDGETIDKDGYTAYLLEKHTQKFAKQPTPLVATITNTRGIIQSLQELFLSLPIQTTYTLLLTDDWEWTNPFLLEEAFWPLSPYGNMVWRSRFEDMMGVYKTVFLRQWVMMAKQGIHPEKQEQERTHAYSANEETRVFSLAGSSVLRNMGRSWFHRESYQRVGDSWQKIQQDKRKKINYTILTE